MGADGIRTCREGSVIALAIFDLDGTLVDSKQNIADAVNYVRSKNGMHALDADFVGSHVNRIDINPAMVFYNTDNFEIWHNDVFTEFYLENCTKNLAMYDGVLECLKKLRSADIKLGIATNGSAKFAEKIVEHFGISDMFYMVLGADSVKNPKPHPDMLSKIIYKANPQVSVLVGDSIKDKQAAKNAGAKFAFAGWGFGPYDVQGDITLAKSNEICKIMQFFE